ncbi:hypothetical protein [Terricaulis silvestris]|uniref:hypothetical protein n=1 Tax=Terricaulis silvestris TaxID=2686094 RepID=UPI001E5C98A5|nr:hypothetical protein [Terricaulis silvestris]
MLIYLPLLLVSQVAGPYFGGGLAQLISAIGALRLAPIVLLIGHWFYTRRGGIALAAVFGAEILIGFLSFFSDWKTVLALAGITLISLARHAWRRSWPLLIGTFVSLLLLGTVWTIIKPNYREILNAGTGQQVILISPDEQAAALSDSILSIKPQDLSDGFLDLLSRVSYVDFLAETLRSVPARIEHQNGGLWGEAFQNILTPRLLFPDKPPLPSDSVRTMQYTGRRLASDSSGTSISIGYVGESYIDFGAFGAIVTAFFMGLVYGVGVLGLVRLSRSGGAALGLALTISFLWPVQQFEMSNVKLVGALGWGWAGSALFAVILWPRLEPFVLMRKPAGQVTPPADHARSRRGP